MQVWLVAYRKFPSLAAIDPPATDDLILAPDLDLPACSNSAMESLLQAFKPCTPIAFASASTAVGAEGQSGVAATYQATLEVAATIRPGAEGLETLRGECVYTHLFGLGSASAEFYLVARDTGPTYKDLDSACSSEAASLVQGVWSRSCR